MGDIRHIFRGRDNQDGQCVSLAAQMLHQFDTVHAWHGKVADHQIRQSTAQGFKCVYAVISQSDHRTERSEEIIQQGTENDFVLNDENMFST